MAEITAGELAARIGLKLRGDGSQLLTGAAVLEEAGPAQVAFAGTAKFFGAASESKAGCIIAPTGYEGHAGQCVLESPQPRAHFAAALEILYPRVAMRAGVHPTAV